MGSLTLDIALPELEAVPHKALFFGVIEQTDLPRVKGNLIIQT
jgi:hypothetical protein